MKIGVLDTDGYFKDDFFKDKKITILRDDISETSVTENKEFTHGEIVCSHIFKENPNVEIILIPIIKNSKCSVLDMINGIQTLIDTNVDMINLSIGDEYKYHIELEDICLKAWKKGIHIVAAYSNNTVEATYPASFPFVLGVGCVNEEKATEILQYDEENNDIIFSSQYFSLYHLGIPKLMSGNSFGCAKITGLLSCRKEHYKFLAELLKSEFNIYYPYQSLKKKRCLFLTNRREDLLEQKFIQKITNTIAVISVEKGMKELERDEISNGRYETVFIDHDVYKDILPYKIKIIHILLKLPKEIVIRYPLFSLFERMEYYEKYHITIHQFSI